MRQQHGTNTHPEAVPFRTENVINTPILGENAQPIDAVNSRHPPRTRIQRSPSFGKTRVGNATVLILNAKI
uniref:Uncharacterized protein n=1 Tax=Arion vulgaris TaxID=1028688 RepID=A0A0B6ZRF1_9EUPU